MIIATAQLHSSKPELRFCTGSNPARGVLEIRDDEDLWQWSRLEIRLRLSPVNHTTKTIHHKLRISVILSSQWNMSLVRIFWVIWRKLMHTREVPDFWGLHKIWIACFLYYLEKSLIRWWRATLIWLYLKLLLLRNLCQKGLWMVICWKRCPDNCHWGKLPLD